MIAPIGERIAAKEAELAQARHALAGVPRNPGTSSLRGKQHYTRVDGAIRRAAQLGETVQRLERELEGLRRQATRPEPQPFDLAALPTARFIRTKVGWYEVVRVNKATVKVLTAPGMDDLVKISKILEIR
jgi:hypothetical protein